jgi:TMEM175 potassium channel family protein
MSADPGRTAEYKDAPSVDRLLALSDGVVAIALTLLVLELRVPPLTDPNSASELATQLGKDSDKLISYLISFYVIANFWLVHHRVFRELTGQRESLAWWNFVFLFTISIMPFTSDLLGEYAENPLAVSVFAVNLLLASLATQATLEIGRRKGLTAPDTDPRAARAGYLRSAGTALVIAASIGLAWVNTDIAKFAWLLIALVPPVVDRWLLRPAGTDSGPGTDAGRPAPGA